MQFCKAVSIEIVQFESEFPMAKTITYIAEAKPEESERAYFPWQETWNLLQKKQKEKRDKPLESNHWVHWVRQSNFSSLIFLMTKTSYLFHRNYNRKGNKSQPLDIRCTSVQFLLFDKVYFSWQKHHIYFNETTTEKKTNLNLWKAASGCPSIPSPSPQPGHLFGKTVQHIHLKCQRCQCASRTCPRGSVTKPPRVSRSIFVSQVIWIFIGSPVDWVLICLVLYFI